MTIRPPKTGRLPSLYRYAVLSLPFLLAALSWAMFPTLANWLSSTLFGYLPLAEPPGWLWYTVAIVYYSWFTILTIGVGGLLVVGAWLSQRSASKLLDCRLSLVPKSCLRLHVSGEEIVLTLVLEPS